MNSLACVVCSFTFLLQATQPSEITKALSLLGQQKYAEAEKVLTPFTQANPTQSRAHILLGYAQRKQQRFDQAIKSFAAAKQSGNPRSVASSEYNLACICSVRKDADGAFKHLAAAVRSGFSNFGQMQGDADFANIRSDSRFKALIPKPVPDERLFSEPTRIIHKFVGEAPGDQFGWTARRVGDWDKDGVIDFVATAPTQSGCGKVYVYSSKSGRLLMEKKGQPGEQFGNSAVGAGDVNKDGFLDLIVGAPNQQAAGNAYVFSGKDGSQLHHFKGTNPGDRFGYEVSELGDLNGDGYADVLVGAASGNGKQPRSGAAFVYSGKSGQLLFQLKGDRTGDSFGNAAACSKSGNHWLLAIGAQNAGPNKRGRVYVYRIHGTQPQQVFTIEGNNKSVNLGQMFIAFPGDVDRDGVPDIYASDFSDNTSAPGGGRVVVVSGKDGRELLAITGKKAREGLGTSPSDAGDVNGDGIGDLVIGAWQNAEEAASGGKVYLHDGANGKLLRAWTCRQSGDTFGFDACGIGDVDGDGAVDFLLTSAWSNTKGPKTGRVFILAGDKVYGE